MRQIRRHLRTPILLRRLTIGHQFVKPDEQVQADKAGEPAREFAYGASSSAKQFFGEHQAEGTPSSTLRRGISPAFTTFALLSGHNQQISPLRSPRRCPPGSALKAGKHAANAFG
jgi:hypothetical protein